MGGPNLEIFKFGFYLFFPIAVMAHFSDPEWYKMHVAPYRQAFWPDPRTLNTNLPSNESEVLDELSRFKAERSARRSENTSDAHSQISEKVEEFRKGAAEREEVLSRRAYQSRMGMQGGAVGGATMGLGPGEKWV